MAKSFVDLVLRIRMIPETSKVAPRCRVDVRQQQRKGLGEVTLPAYRLYNRRCEPAAVHEPSGFHVETLCETRHDVNCVSMNGSVYKRTYVHVHTYNT